MLNDHVQSRNLKIIEKRLLVNILFNRMLIREDQYNFAEEENREEARQEWLNVRNHYDQEHHFLTLEQYKTRHILTQQKARGFDVSHELSKPFLEMSIDRIYNADLRDFFRGADDVHFRSIMQSTTL